MSHSPIIRAGALLLVLLASTPSHATVRPDPLTPEPGCERWVGKAGGNDPSVQIDLVLCPKGDNLEGQLQWSSLQSGWNLRAVQGRWTGGGNALELADVRIVKEKPNPGWRFCPIDRYELELRGPDSLEGHYVSTPCQDRASVSLTRAAPPAGTPSTNASATSPNAPPAASATSPAATSPTAAPPAGPTTEKPEPDPPARCGCRLVGGARAPSSGAGAIALLLLGAAGARRKRFGRGRAIG